MFDLVDLRFPGLVFAGDDVEAREWAEEKRVALVRGGVEVLSGVAEVAG